MKIRKKMPKKGRFIGVWEWNNKLWCGNFKWKKGILTQYHSEVDAYRFTINISGVRDLLNAPTTRFIKL